MGMLDTEDRQSRIRALRQLGQALVQAPAPTFALRQQAQYDIVSPCAGRASGGRGGGASLPACLPSFSSAAAGVLAAVQGALGQEVLAQLGPRIPGATSSVPGEEGEGRGGGGRDGGWREKDVHGCWGGSGKPGLVRGLLAACMRASPQVEPHGSTVGKNRHWSSVACYRGILGKSRNFPWPRFPAL